MKIPLKDIKFVLLDMDGTLLDKYFDDFFWEHLVPEKYAEKHNITFGKAKEELMEKYKVHEGTLNWTDLDFWSKELHLDIPALKEQIRHLIEVHPHVIDFLKDNENPQEENISSDKRTLQIYRAEIQQNTDREIFRLSAFFF